jgi:hypothetical protein
MAKITVAGLSPSTNYVAFGVAKDPIGNTGDDASVIEIKFKTQKKFNDAKFTCHTTVKSSTEVVKAGCARAMGVPNENIKFIGVDPNTSNGRMLQDVSTTYEYDFQLRTDTEHEDLDPRSIVKGTSSDALSSNIPGYDVTQPITDSLTEVVASKPVFREDPRITGRGNGIIVVEGVLNTAGKIYGVLMSSSDKQPDSRQISTGLNSLNEALPSGSFDSVSVAFETPATLTFENTDDTASYNIWMSGENDRFGGLPDLMEDYDLKRVIVDAPTYVALERETVIYTTMIANVLMIAIYALAF